MAGPAGQAGWGEGLSAGAAGVAHNSSAGAAAIWPDASAARGPTNPHPEPNAVRCCASLTPGSCHLCSWASSCASLSRCAKVTVQNYEQQQVLVSKANLRSDQLKLCCSWKRIAMLTAPFHCDTLDPLHPTAPP